jgi:hypothetical protein
MSYGTAEVCTCRHSDAKVSLKSKNGVYGLMISTFGESVKSPYIVRRCMSCCKAHRGVLGLRNRNRHGGILRHVGGDVTV